MKKITRFVTCMVTIAAILLVSGCHKENPVTDYSSTINTNTGEGIYFGIIGFNSHLYVKDINLLNSSTYGSFNSFIDNLTPGDGTALYYADYTALKKMMEYNTPPKLKNVALVTFTDGLDNISTANSEYDPAGYGSTNAYREALHNKILNEPIHGLNVAAYTIGLKGNDVTDQAQFMENLRKLASNDNNVFQVSNMNEAMERFSEIAASLYSVSTSVNLGVSVPGGYDDGQLLRFTFDNVNAATSSTKYIQVTYRRPSSNTRTLDNITYHGFAQGAISIASSTSQGAYYQFIFEDLRYSSNGNSISQSDLNNIKLWKQTSTGAWDKETEFNPASSSTITEDKNSALIMLVLDCTTSLGSDFTNMQQSAKRFVNTLANVNVNGGGGTGGGTGGGLSYLLNENFDNGVPASWTSIDNDGDGYNWFSSNTLGWNNGHNGSSGCMMSASYNSNDGALDPDNWLITPAITIPSNASAASLQFWVCAQDADWAEEHYGVYITTSSNYPYFSLLFEETIDANGGSKDQGTWKQKTVSLQAYAGQTVYIAFRHFNCTDMFYLNIDDVTILYGR